MNKKPRLPKPSTPSECSEDTLIMNPASSSKTQLMAASPDHPLDVTLVINPGAGDITASGLEPGQTHPESREVEGVNPLAVGEEPAKVPLLPSFEPQPTPQEREFSVSRPYILWVGLAAGLLVLAGAFWYFDKEKPAPISISIGSEGQDTLPAPVPAGYQETLRQAQGGDVVAMRTLGAVYTYGLGVPPHRQEGLRWYRKAAEAGSPVAAEEANAMEGPSKR